MCLYHMKQIIVRYLTKKPKLEQNKKLIEISRFIWDLEKEQIEKLLIPSTNNSLEAINSHLKTKLKIHRWLKENKKDTFTCYYLYNS